MKVGADKDRSRMRGTRWRRSEFSEMSSETGGVLSRVLRSLGIAGIKELTRKTQGSAIYQLCRRGRDVGLVGGGE